MSKNELNNFGVGGSLPPKPAADSKTLWANGLVGLLAIVANIIPALEGIVAEVPNLFIGGTALMNIFLRFKTKRAIKLK